jgi:hypothetical protein
MWHNVGFSSTGSTPIPSNPFGHSIRPTSTLTPYRNWEARGSCQHDLRLVRIINESFVWSEKLVTEVGYPPPLCATTIGGAPDSYPPNRSPHSVVLSARASTCSLPQPSLPYLPKCSGDKTRGQDRRFTFPIQSPSKSHDSNEGCHLPQIEGTCTMTSHGSKEPVQWLEKLHTYDLAT